MILDDWQKFFLFLIRKKLLGFNFCLVAFSLIFLPSQGYYQTAEAKWEKPKIQRSQFSLPPPVLYPQNKTGVKPPEISAPGVLILDLGSQVHLLEKNLETRFLPASTVKMMTALVSLEEFTKDKVLTVPKLVDDGQDIKLGEGEQVTVESLLYALLVASANDAAETLAASFPGGRATFVEKMNQKAKDFYLKNTHFTNPTGMDDEDQYSSVFDLAILTKKGMQNPLFAQIVGTKAVTIASVDGKRRHQMTNINQLLGKVEGVKGVKTGWTEQAGECLVAYVERNEHKVIFLILASQDRFGETEKLIDWVFANFEWFTPTPNI